jgi:hypothetical protein
MRQTVSGPFSARELRNGFWRLTAASGPEIYLQDAGPDASELLRDVSIATLCVEWRADGVTVAVAGNHGVRYLSTAGAIIHEPKARLYENLPLASFDADAKRFWTRVFRLIRIPGGRFLLGFIARRNRGKSIP